MASAPLRLSAIRDERKRATERDSKVDGVSREKWQRDRPSGTIVETAFGMKLVKNVA